MYLVNWSSLVTPIEAKALEAGAPILGRSLSPSFKTTILAVRRRGDGLASRLPACRVRSSGTSVRASTVEETMRSAAVLLALTFVASTGCSSVVDGGGRRPVGLASMFDVSPDQLTLFLGVDSCNGGPTAVVDQGPDVIRVSVESFIPGGDESEACADAITVVLDEPLSDRLVVDGVTDRELRPTRVFPAPLEALPLESELNEFEAPDLTGWPVEDIQAWAEQSGLTNVDVFESADEIETRMEYDPHRLVLVVQHGLVVQAQIG